MQYTSWPKDGDHSKWEAGTVPRLNGLCFGTIPSPPVYLLKRKNEMHDRYVRLLICLFVSFNINLIYRFRTAVGLCYVVLRQRYWHVKPFSSLYHRLLCASDKLWCVLISAQLIFTICTNAFSRSMNVNLFKISQQLRWRKTSTHHWRFPRIIFSSGELVLEVAGSWELLMLSPRRPHFHAWDGEKYIYIYH